MQILKNANSELQPQTHGRAVGRLLRPQDIVAVLGFVSLAASIFLLTFGYQQHATSNRKLATKPADPMSLINRLVQSQPVVEGCPAAEYAPRLYLGHTNFTNIGSTCTNSKLPEKFATTYDLSKTIRNEYFPKLYTKMHAGAGGPHHNQPVQFHWVLTSCTRRQWGRTISSALLSGLSNDLYPASISILWCRPYNVSEVPALLYNMRHSHQINVLYRAPELEATNASLVTKLMVSALSVPCALGMPNLPILYTEDDVIFAPDANARLANAMTLMPQPQLNEPFALSLYNPGAIAPTPKDEAHITQKPDDFSAVSGSHSAEIRRINPVYGFGIQGVFFSPAMVSLLLDHNMAIMQGKEPSPAGWQDLVVWNTITKKWKCNQPGSGCSYYSVEPSLVQHIGTTSSVFMTSGLNQRYHAAHDFPVRVRFPGYEPDNTW